MEFGRRMATERDLEKTNSLKFSNVGNELESQWRVVLEVALAVAVVAIAVVAVTAAAAVAQEAEAVAVVTVAVAAVVIAFAAVALVLVFKCFMWQQQKSADDFVALKGVLCVWNLLDSSHPTTNIENLVLAVAVHGCFCFGKLFLNI